MHKPNKRTKSTNISSLFPKRGNRNTKRTEKHKNKMTHGKTYNKSPRRINHEATKSKTNTGTTTSLLFCVSYMFVAFQWHPLSQYIINSTNIIYLESLILLIGKCRYRFRNITLADNFKWNRYKRIGYSLDIMRQTACLVVNPIIVDG